MTRDKLRQEITNGINEIRRLHKHDIATAIKRVSVMFPGMKVEFETKEELVAFGAEQILRQIGQNMGLANFF